MLEQTYLFMKISILSLFIDLSIVFTLVFLLNLFDQRKSFQFLKDKQSFVFRPTFNSWATFIKRRKNYSVIPYILIVGVGIYGIVQASYPIIVSSFAFFIWKQTSLYWPVTMIFSKEGIYTWDPLIMAERKNFETFLSWDSIQKISYLEDTKEILIETTYSSLICPITDEQAQSFTDWLKQEKPFYFSSLSHFKSTSY